MAIINLFAYGSRDMSLRVTLMGAGGKVGCRITDLLKDDPEYDVDYVEPSEEGRERLRERGVEATPAERALPEAEAVIMAVPDELMADIAADVVERVDSGTLLTFLDPAAAHAGALPDREDVSYFVTHPCHPSFFTAETELDDDNTDWFGGQGRDPQDVVCALHQGPEADYAKGEALARDIYAPVRHAHRMTTAQMALLEPALVESLLSTCLFAVKDGLDCVVAEGVPREAAEEFLFGHIRISIGIIFGFTGFPYSDGAQQAIAEAREEIFRDGWEDRLFDPENVRESVSRIAGAED